MSKIKRTCPRCSGDLTQSPAGDIAQLECTKCRSIFRLKEGSSIALGSDEKSSAEKSNSTIQKFNAETQAASLGSDEKPAATNAEETLKSNQDTAAKSQAVTTDKPAQTESKPSNSTVPANEKSIGMLGRFELREVLGQGAFGRVFRAYDPQIDRMVALKVPIFGEDEQKKAQRFQAEAKSAGRLRHPNIVPTFETGRVGKNFYIASQFIEGATLAARIKSFESEPISFEQAAEWAKSIASALAYAHEMGIIHRDVKPQNIMLDKRNEPQLMDFGLAKRLNEDSAATTEGSLLGTPAYMSPEQARGEVGKVGAHSDQYAIGAILYELLTGQRPFDGPPHAVLAQVIGAEPKNPRSVRPEVPRDLEAITLKAMSKESSKRYASCEALAEDLSNWLRGDAISARPPSTFEKLGRWAKRNKQVAALGVGLITVVTTALISISIALLYMNDARKEAADNFLKADEQAKLARDAEVKATATAAHLKLVLEEVTKEKNRADEKAAEAQREKLVADEQRKEAEKQRSVAEEQKRLAEEQTALATSAAKREREATEEARTASEREKEAGYPSAIQQVDRLIKDENYSLAREELYKIRRDLRSWEWDYLNQLVNPASSINFRVSLEGAFFSSDSRAIWHLGPDKFEKFELASGQITSQKSPLLPNREVSDLLRCDIASSDGKHFWICCQVDLGRPNKGTEYARIVTCVEVGDAKFTPATGYVLEPYNPNVLLLCPRGDTCEITNHNSDSRLLKYDKSANVIVPVLDGQLSPIAELTGKDFSVTAASYGKVLLRNGRKAIVFDTENKSVSSSVIEDVWLSQFASNIQSNYSIAFDDLKSELIRIHDRTGESKKLPLKIGIPSALAMAPKGTKFAVAYGNSIHLFDTVSLQEIGEIRLHRGVGDIQFSPNSDWLYVDADDSSFAHHIGQLLSKPKKPDKNAILSGKPLFVVFEDNLDRATAIVISDSNDLYRISNDDKRWTKLAQFPDEFVPIGLTSDGPTVYGVDGRSGKIQFQRIGEKQWHSFFPEGAWPPPDANLNWADSSKVKELRQSLRKRYWYGMHAQSQRIFIRQIPPGTERVDRTELSVYSFDGKRLGSFEGRNNQMRPEDRATAIWNSPDGTRLVTLDGVWKRKTVFGITAAGLEGISSLTGSVDSLRRGSDFIQVLCLNDNGVVASAYGEQVVIWNWGQLIDDDCYFLERSLDCKGHRGKVSQVLLTGNGSRLISGSEDGTVRIWNAKVGEQLLQLCDFGEPVRGIDLSADERFLVAVSESGNIQFLDTGPKTTPTAGSQ